MTVLADTVNFMQSKMGDILQTFQSQPLRSLGTANTEDNLVNEQSVNDNAINQNISQIVPEHVLYECAEKYQSHHTLPLELPTPINPGILLRYLQDYDQEGTNYVVNGFTQGFSVSCLDFKTTLNCRNLP
jgi:hypothetical protein